MELEDIEDDATDETAEIDDDDEHQELLAWLGVALAVVVLGLLAVMSAVFSAVSRWLDGVGK